MGSLKQGGLKWEVFFEKVDKIKNCKLRKLRIYKIEIFQRLVLVYDKSERVREIKLSLPCQNKGGGAAAPSFSYFLLGLASRIPSDLS